MGNERIKILVACHKADKIYQDDIYLPIHVGKACSSFNLGYQGDDTGENISLKNPYYSELTALYWAWKNLHDIEYLGLCHYRRYFDFSTLGYSTRIISENELDELGKKNSQFLLKNLDKIGINEVILPTYWREPHSIIEHFEKCVLREDMQILFNVIKHLCPEYIPTVKKYMLGNRRTGYNMFIMHKKEFNKYAEWLFNILGETEKHVRLCQYATYQRIYGYMSEWLLPIYCEYNSLKIKQARIFMVTDHSRKHTYGIKCIKNMLCNLVFPIYKRLAPQYLFDEYWEKWMKIDGIKV